jgi:DNA processing protein
MSGRGTKFSPDANRRDNTHLRDGVAFGLLPHMGSAAFREAIERCGSAAEALRGHPRHDERVVARQAAGEAVARAQATGADILVQGEPEYPAPLLDLPQPPRLLYALGGTPLLCGRRVGIVGTRHSSASGDRIAADMAAILVRAGATVVSGMAFGIDAASHRGALDAGGATVAVLGGGADVPYPPAHRTLHERIMREGLVVSEMPLGTRPGKGAFPRRNRIIAALSDTLIVIEAGERSGALITARIALELGRTVAVVPGAIDSPRHAGSNQLLADGASFIARVEDVLSIASIDPVAPTSKQQVNDAPAVPNHASILEAIRAGTSDLEDLARSSRLPPRELAAALSSLELAGRIHVSPGGAVSLSSTG